eukprot:TRINITY_DN52194_c0_g1_i1.p1 TRINITY_DN52194_c0_g1~~TRINITY_DN52194_c0_g1_i1.p1  ORF type:complete len:640 (+),score=54.27 TRINITY_DN52194_c0_g1_i1:56-1975(+)
MPLQQESFIGQLLFPRPHPSYTIDCFPGELIWIPSCLAQGDPTVLPSDDCKDTLASSCSVGDSVPCLFLPCQSARFLILFFHSNGEDLGRCRWFCHWLNDQMRVHVLAVEYPGYGVAAGVPSRDAVLETARAALYFVTFALRLSLEHVLIFGRSIGTGPALALAARFRVGGVVLVSPFRSIKSLFRERIGPLANFVEEWFPNDEDILNVTSSTMFIHGRKDFLIPCHHSDELYDCCRVRKMFVNPEEMEHNTNLTADVGLLIEPLYRFFNLPSYSSQEVRVPSWALDKRRSHLYPKCVASIRRAFYQPPGVNSDNATVTEGVRAATSLLCGSGKGKAGLPEETGDLLTQPTVLHRYTATKQRYDFQCLTDVRASKRDDGHAGSSKFDSCTSHTIARIPSPKLPTPKQAAFADEARRHFEASVSAFSLASVSDLALQVPPHLFCSRSSPTPAGVPLIVGDTDLFAKSDDIGKQATSNLRLPTSSTHEKDFAGSIESMCKSDALQNHAMCREHVVTTDGFSFDGRASSMPTFIVELGKPASNLLVDSQEWQNHLARLETLQESQIMTEYSIDMLRKSDRGNIRPGRHHGVRPCQGVLISCGSLACSDMFPCSCASPFDGESRCSCFSPHCNDASPCTSLSQ